MSVIEYAWWLANAAFRLLILWWPVTLLLAVATVVLLRFRPLEDDADGGSELRSLPSVLLLFPVLILLWGSIARVDTADAGGIGWRASVTGLLLVGHVLATVAVVYVSRGYRHQTLMLGVFIGWITSMCGYVAILAVTGGLAPPPGAGL